MDYSKYQTLAVTVDAGLAVVTLNRPEKLNAISAHGDSVSHIELENIWIDLGQDPDVAAIIITGAGRAFSAGGNLRAMADRAGKPEGWKNAVWATRGAPRLLNNLLSVPQPVISAVNGDAMGLGATVALFADTVVISETARIGDTHVKVGLVAGDGGTVIWPMLLGIARAKDFLMRAKVIDGKEAERIGLVTCAVPQDRVMPEAVGIAEEFMKLPPLAVRWTKASINQTLKEQFVRAMDAAIALEALSMLSSDHAEAARAFLEKRPPRFSGM